MVGHPAGGRRHYVAGHAHLVQRPRPDYFVAQDPRDLGYPSGHVMNAVVIAALTMQTAFPGMRSRWPKVGIALAWVALLAAIATSRIYRHAHYATDNIAGFFMGLCRILVVLRTLPRLFGQDNRSAGMRRIGPLPQHATSRTSLLPRQKPVFSLTRCIAGFMVLVRIAWSPEFLRAQDRRHLESRRDPLAAHFRAHRSAGGDQAAVFILRVGQKRVTEVLTAPNRDEECVRDRPESCSSEATNCSKDGGERGVAPGTGVGSGSGHASQAAQCVA